ncbi:MAG: sulfate adenylyltransferase [Desulfobacteraceae bacterium]|nr:sulfate adenylyltransferase [Desulfobacteraceae bacterium]
MSDLIPPHGGKGLTICMLEGAELEEEKKKAQGLKRVSVTPRERGDLIMIGTGGFSPLTGFMTKADWKGVCDNFQLAGGTFWPVPVTLSASQQEADAISEGDEIALHDPETDKIMATMKVTEKFEMTEENKRYECEKVFMGEGTSTKEEFWKIAEEEHPGVQMVMNQKPYNLAGPVKVLSEAEFPTKYKGIYMRPSESRKIFEERGWKRIAALQLRNPMHRSHEYLAKIAIEVSDGCFIHSLVGNLKPGDIPADVRVKCIDVLVNNYFVPERVLQGGYPLDMRYAGPREALLHATFRQNYGCSHMIIGRDHAGVGDFYGMFEAQTIFDKIPYPEGEGKALLCKPLKIDWTFYCHKCDGMASLKTCPHSKEDRVILSGTMLRKLLSEGGRIPDHFGREEVLDILRDYYQGLTEKVEVKLHGAATGDEKKK